MAGNQSFLTSEELARLGPQKIVHGLKQSKDVLNIDGLLTQSDKHPVIYILILTGNLADVREELCREPYGWLTQPAGLLSQLDTPTAPDNLAAITASMRLSPQHTKIRFPQCCTATPALAGRYSA